MIIALIKVIKKYFYTENSNLINKLKRNKHIKSTKTQKNMFIQHILNNLVFKILLKHKKFFFIIQCIIRVLHHFNY